MFAAAGISTISRLSVKSSNLSGRLAAVSSGFSAPVSWCFLLEFAGFNEVDESCGSDVEDVLVLELDDSPGTTKGT